MSTCLWLWHAFSLPEHFPLGFSVVHWLQRLLSILCICSWIFLFVCIPTMIIHDLFGPSPQVTVPSFSVPGLWHHFTFMKLQLNIAIMWPTLQLTVWLRRLSEPSAPDSAAWMGPRGHYSTHQRSPATSSWLVVSSTTSPWSMEWIFGPLQWQDPWNNPPRKSMSTWSPWT